MKCPAVSVYRVGKNNKKRKVNSYWGTRPKWLKLQPSDIEEPCTGILSVHVQVNSGCCCHEAASLEIEYRCKTCKEITHGGYINMPTTTYDLETYLQKELDANDTPKDPT